MEYEKVCPDDWDITFVFQSHNFTTRGCSPYMSCIEVPGHKNDQLTCPPMTVDGLGLCFEQTIAGSVATTRCPFGENYAHHVCYENGTWADISKNIISACLAEEVENGTTNISRQLLQIEQLYTMAYVGRAISLVWLLFTLFFFILIRNNHQKHFNKVHMNLIVSLIFNCMMVILLKRFLGPEEMVNNENWCTALHVTYTYSYECTVFWMLAEGIYLNTYMMNFHSRFSFKIYIAMLMLGWVVPLLIILGWFATKINHDHHSCLNYDMMDNNLMDIDMIDIDLIVKVPTYAALTINLLLYVNIIRMVCIQNNFLNSELSPSRRSSIIKLMVTLLPLLGISYLLEIPMLEEKDIPTKIKWMFANYFFQSFQGLFVSVVFWLTLNDLRDALRGAFLGNDDNNDNDDYKQTLNQEMTEVVTTNLVAV